MLIEFKVTNYRSICDEQTLSLVASHSDKTELPENKIVRRLPGEAGLDYLKSAVLYGPNASGKSNILRAFASLASFVEASAYKLAPNAPTFAVPFKLDVDYLAQPSKFEITFVAESIRYLFILSLTNKRIIEESLVAYPKGLPQQWYVRTWNESTHQYDWKFASSTYFKKGRGLTEKTRQNATFLSTAAQFEHPQLKSVYDWFVDIKVMQLGGEHHLSPLSTAQRMLDSEMFHSTVETLIKNADIGIASANVEKANVEKVVLSDEEKKRQFDKMKKHRPLPLIREIEQGADVNVEIFETRIALSHSGKDGSTVDMDFATEESEGTRQYFSLLGPWLKVLQDGGVLIVDEIETSLHPMLVRELIKLFNSEKLNPKGAQLIFTSHNPYLLDLTLFRRDQIWFTEKNKEGATQLYPLTDFQPRKDEAIVKGYLAGRYGAVPYIPEGLLQ